VGGEWLILQNLKKQVFVLDEVEMLNTLFKFAHEFRITAKGVGN
jgi:hypothetical protein